jgi:hypothetical protein
MAKDKKKKNKAKKAAGPVRSVKQTLRGLSENQLLSEVVAAALVGAAAALKDSKKARQLAAQAGDELESMAKAGAERGNAMWDLALDIGRRSLDAIAGDQRSKAPKAKKAPAAAKAAKAPKARKSPRKSKAATARKPGTKTAGRKKA